MDFLLKVGESKYIEDMYENEYLFFKSFRTFRGRGKDSTGRNDPREANTTNRQVKNLQIAVGEKTFKLHEMLASFNAQLNEHPAIIPNNICSLYTLHVNESFSYEKVDLKMVALGEKTLMIYKIGTFYDLLDNQLAQQQIEFSRKPVIYYDYRMYDGHLTFHHKDKDFSYQKEYRILLQTSGTENIRISLPGLKKISAVVSTSEINSLKIKPLPSQA